WDVDLVVAVPEFTVATERARAALPASVPFADAVANVSRAAWLVAAMLTGRVDLLGTAMEDRLHQPYRRRLVPGMEEAFTAADAARTSYGCEKCFGPREAIYDNEALARQPLRRVIESGPPSIWRYEPLLPVNRVPEIDLSPGFTPLMRAARLGRALGLSSLY